MNYNYNNYRETINIAIFTVYLLVITFGNCPLWDCTTWKWSCGLASIDSSLCLSLRLWLFPWFRILVNFVKHTSNVLGSPRYRVHYQTFSLTLFSQIFIFLNCRHPVFVFLKWRDETVFYNHNSWNM